MIDGRVEIGNGLVLDFDSYDPRIGPDGSIRWWARCTVLPVTDQ